MGKILSGERIGAAITRFRERVLGLAKWRLPQFRKASTIASAPGVPSFWQKPAPARAAASVEDKPRHVVTDCTTGVTWEHHGIDNRDNS